MNQQVERESDSPMTSGRFVILRHDIGKNFQRATSASSVRESHLDWMFEQPTALKTFATKIIDPRAEIDALLVDPLPDHRLAYLDYEGEISGDRGSVTRIAQGVYELIEASDALWRVRMAFDASPGPDQAMGNIAYRTRFEASFADIRGVWQLRSSATR